ncbi:hypothetical protein ACFL5Z_13255 [Planctomycetota bacterium]
MPRKNGQLSGKWTVVAMPDLTEDYLKLTRNPRIEINREKDGVFEGLYSFGAQTGEIYGVLRKDLTSYPFYVFSFEGEDEGDEVHGAGIMRLSEDNFLVGEWIYHNGDILRIECRR